MNQESTRGSADRSSSWQERITLPPRPDAAEAFQTALLALVHDFGVDEIWIFGSCARGIPTRHSDVDLLVVRPAQPDCPRPAAAARLCLARLPYFFPADIIVLDPAQWNERRRHPVGVYLDIVRNGACVYAR